MTLTEARAKSLEEADDLVRQFSGHSMRSGYATAAGAADMPSYRIMQHTRRTNRWPVTDFRYLCFMAHGCHCCAPSVATWVQAAVFDRFVPQNSSMVR